MAKNQFTELDRQILDAVKNGKNTFVRISAVVAGQERQIDRRLQALKRAGKITYTGQARDNGWKLVQEAQP